MSHSFDGLIATAYARQYPQRVLGLVHVNSILNLPASMESMTTQGYKLLPAATRPPLDAIAPLPQRFGMVWPCQQHLMDRLMYSQDSTAGRLACVHPAQPANHDFVASPYAPGVIDGYLEDLAVASSRLAMPVLVLPGQADNVTGPQYQSFHFQHQRVVLMPGKHYFLLKNPREVSQALAAFVRQLPHR